MESGTDENIMLDYAIFHTSPASSSYEALACINGKMEKVATGPLDQLGLHLSEAKRCQTNQSVTSFKLQLVESQKGFSWFTKVTLARFLHIVNTPDALKAASAIEDEISQLEETKKFHISLYTKDHDRSADGTTGRFILEHLIVGRDNSCLKEAGRNQKVKVETASSDATKNELLRALDLRLTVLEEELSSSFNRAAGATCYRQQIYDISAFTEHFGAIDLRNFLLKLLARLPPDPSVVQPVSPQDIRNNSGNSTQDVSLQARETVAELVKNVVSPAKVAQAERQSSSGSEDSSDSSGEDQSRNERSRSIVRSATPRRYASPMRRVQIGRSGSRRSASIAIKSLIPARERTTSIRDNSESNSEDEELGQPAKRPENPVRRMSVQDAISLFESKQKDQLDIQQRRASGQVSASITAKSVLRRWSSGMSESVAHNSHSVDSNAAPQETREENKTEVDNAIESTNTEESPQVAQSSEVDNTMLSPVESPAEPVILRVEEVNDRAATSAEWSRQKEAELNQMLMKMMQSKPGKYRGSNGINSVQKDMPSEQKGGFYSQYREKRDEKLRVERGGKKAAKDTHLKGTKDNLEHSKAAVSSKSATAIGKRDSPNNSQRPRRNSSPPVLPKKEVPKQASTKKASPRTPLPATRSSWSAGSLPRTSGIPSPRTPGTVSTTSTTNHRKPLSTPSATQPSPRTERLQQTKVKKGTPPDVKPSSKGQEEKKQRSVTKSTKSVKAKVPATPGDDLSVKPSFYNKGTKKSSVVPLESKPFLKKGTGTGPRGSSMTAKPKASQHDDFLTNSENLIQTEESESSAITTEPTPKLLEVDVVQAETGNANIEISLDNDLNCNQMGNRGKGIDELESGFKDAVELPVPEIQVETVDISSAAWVEEDHEQISASCEYVLPENSISPELASAAALSSPKVRHSLSQMMQADNNEPDIIEWGNAENPPALVYQKDAPKGFKRLLKFARKSKGEANVTGWASPSVFSEGEDDAEESKAASKRSSDVTLRKAALQAKGYEPPKSMFSGSVDGANSSNRSMDFQGMSELVPGQSNGRTATILDRLREGQNSGSTASTKATRSFFSLSTFRSSKSSETKLR
ncbi:serine/arginine repetitive matrix protein 1-like isoform X2 [Asparagus officinalis]|uniref:serine/arginine repetitive matrix protein 1-like isoform X2 n=1 Tax=Asparagus officinalis TaxID=4686 RepID=UPI00098E7EFF|nr:serine/arginine repetitive matrix protein 1-like isoform X2 [Asparagus officinalis]